MAGWTTIKVPMEVAEEVRRIARKKNKPQWQVLVDALAFYRERYTNGFGSKDGNVRIDIDKISYYIMKLSKSVAWLQREPTRENLEWLKKTCQQIKERLGINTDILVRAADSYVRTKSKEDYAEINMALKMVIADLIGLLGCKP